jgi:hypothetical protein
MSLQKCKGENGRSGWRWGVHGKCYQGEGAQEKAEDAGMTILNFFRGISKNKRKRNADV